MARARKFFEEECAKAVLDRATAGREGSATAPVPANLEAARAKSDEGMEKARRAFEEERARKAEALERARKRAAEAADAARSAAAGTPASGSAPPAARPAAGVNGAAAGAKAAGAVPAGAGGTSQREVDDARAKSQQGVDRARQAYEAERARKAAALERARAKAAAAGAAAAAQRPGAGENGDRRGTGENSAGSRPWGQQSSGSGVGFAAAGVGHQEARPAPGHRTYEEKGPSTMVRITGLKDRPQLNGQLAMLVRFDDRKGRWQVRPKDWEDILLKDANLVPLTAQEYEELKEAQAQEDSKIEREAKAIHTRASDGKMRWCDDDREGAIERGPGEHGNEFDVLMSEETDGVEAAEKIVDVLEQRGVCVCEANAPVDLLSQAFDEAEALWEAGVFGPPMRVFDQEGEQEAQVWKEVLYQDETKVLWINPEESESRVTHRTKALTRLSENMLEFCRGMSEILHRKMGISFTHLWNAMVSCYTGDRSYSVHIDNPHGGEDESGRLPDNGLRLTLCYYINPHWAPEYDNNGGGLDVFLTDPRTTPLSAASARRLKKLRIAPHADTLVLFLPERMAHQVISTRGKERNFCMTMWCYDQEVMNMFVPRVNRMRRLEWRSRYGGDADSDGEVD